MLNDLPVDMEVLEELNISCLDPMLKDYVFSSFFLARLLDKTLKEKNELAKENESLKAKIGDYDNLKRTFEELKKTLDAMSDVPHMDDVVAGSEGVEAPDMKPLGFMGRNRQVLEEALGEEGELDLSGDLGLSAGEAEAVTDTDDLAASVEALLSADESVALEAGAEEVSDSDIAAALEGLGDLATEEVAVDAGLEGLGDIAVDETATVEEAVADVDLGALGDIATEEIPADVNLEGLGDIAVEDVNLDAALADIAVEEPVAEEAAAVADAEVNLEALAAETEALLGGAEEVAEAEAVAEAVPEDIVIPEDVAAMADSVLSEADAAVQEFLERIDASLQSAGY